MGDRAPAQIGEDRTPDRLALPTSAGHYHSALCSNHKPVTLRADGVRLRKGELPEPVRGHLVIEDDASTSISFKRPIRRAHVYRSIGAQQLRQECLTPIVDPGVIRIEGEVITIAGTQLASVDGRVVEHGQVWRATLVRE